MFSEALVANLSRGTQASEHALYSNIQIQRLQNYLLKESDQERCMRTMYDARREHKIVEGMPLPTDRLMCSADCKRY